MPIPLDRVHICTLHALVRIVEKMIHHSCAFVWNMKDEKERKAGIERVERVLSEAGLHGGCVKLEKDMKRSGKQSVPAKVSIGGDRARHFLKNTDPKRKGLWEFGLKLVLAERDRTSRANAIKKKMDSWNALSDLNVLLQKRWLTSSNKSAFRDVVTKFTKSYIEAWGETEVTHYIHILYAHCPWFVDKWGSLGIWNTQGMEKSHKQAKAAFHRTTQRGGGRCTSNSNPLQQMSFWFYRRVVARHERIVRERLCPQFDYAIKVASKKRRAEFWKNSDAYTRCMEWRQKKCRVGSKYAPPLSNKSLESGELHSTCVVDNNPAR